MGIYQCCSDSTPRYVMELSWIHSVCVCVMCVCLCVCVRYSRMALVESYILVKVSQLLD